MRKLLGAAIVTMSLFAMLVGCGGATLKTMTFTQNATWLAPLTTSRLETAAGYGARGQNAGSYYVQQYDRYYYTQAENSPGNIDTSDSIYDSTYSGSPPADYCNPWITSGGRPQRTCFTHVNSSYFEESPATTGASATITGPSGFATRTFPGSTGNVAQTTTTFNNVTVTPGQSYQIVVPSGGSVTITYYE